MKESFLSSTRKTTFPTQTLHNEGKLPHASFPSSTGTNVFSSTKTTTFPTTKLHNEGIIVNARTIKEI
jgi:hypothetical protein